MATVLSPTALDQLCINTIRFLAVDAVERANSGHPGTPMGAAPMAYVLWDRFLKHNPADPHWQDRDRFILSPGHASALLYALLHLTGYDLPLDELKQFRQWGSKTPGHPEYGLTPGVEMTTGPLGQGFAHGVGMAIAERWLADHYNRPGHEIVDHFTYAIVSDGDLQEGVASEAASLAGTLRLGKLIYLYDDNDISIEGNTDIAFAENVAQRFQAYGWHVIGPIDGMDTAQVDSALRMARAEIRRPSLIICRTVIGYGSPHKAGTAAAHGEPLGPEETNLAKERLGWTYPEPFAVPAEALAHLRQALVRGSRAQEEWQAQWEAYRAAFPEEARQLDEDLRGDLPNGWDSELEGLFPGGQKPIATREASGQVMNAIARRVHAFTGGSADLAPSTKTTLKDHGNYGFQEYCGHNMHFGVREHAMGAIANGMAIHGGTIPYTATFLIFSDYMRPAIRLGALMGQRVIYIFTHDSIGLGEDGPTHQPIEQLVGLRAIPELMVLRPADATETVEAWRVALERRGPTALVLSRQNLPVLDRSTVAPARGVQRGGYILWQSGEPEVILIATGSEVHIALEAGRLLSEGGVAARIVSLPSWELFDAQPREYRDSVLPPDLRRRIAIEAGSPLGWERYVGLDGAVIGLPRFGASAPAAVLYEQFGFTAGHMVEEAMRLVKGRGWRVEGGGWRGKGTMNAVQRAQQLGQSIWYDNIRRGLLTSGEFRQLVELGVTGVTANPTILEKAIAGSTDYDQALMALAQSGKSAKETYEALAVEDIQAAADLLRGVYERSGGGDGFASLEVSPELAHDTEGTIAEARRLFAALDRPNVMIKVPATQGGIPAIRRLIGEGVNVNVTLIFSLDDYRQVIEAYIAGLGDLARSGGDIARVASVASFFVSRVDTVVDALLEERIHSGEEQLRPLLGRAGIANARLAYQICQTAFGGERFAALRARGARVQRPLWASTGTKNPAYSDVLYVESLLGPETVNTVPPATLTAFLDHGHAEVAVERHLEEARETVAALEAAGISLSQVTARLLAEGVRAFADSFAKLMSNIAEKRDRLPHTHPGASLGGLHADVDAAVAGLAAEEVVGRIWRKDHTVWKPDPTEIANRLGWLTVGDLMEEQVASLQAFAREVRQSGVRDVVLLGMGGSSLGAEVLRQSFGSPAGYPHLRVLDSTVPGWVHAVNQAIDPARTLFLVSSKSGTTMEPLALYHHFRRLVEQSVPREVAGRCFVAITDPGTPLERLAREEGFRRAFLNPADIGGRYSVLSYFGLVPAALAGMAIETLLDRAERMRHACVSCVPCDENPGAWLGAAMAALARRGRDKLTLITSPALAGFGPWVEQLIAESTGKEGRGILPVAGEPLLAPDRYGDDRFFVYLRLEGDDNAAADAALDGLAAAGQPVMRLRLQDRFDLGAEFFRWEFATAVAGAILGIHPFDQPDVEGAKELTSRLLRGDQTMRRLSVASSGSLPELLTTARPGDYCAVLAYLQPTPEVEQALAELRRRVAERYRIATTLGFGPRYLHSTGQLHKGGPDTGLFLLITADHRQDLHVPGEPYSFGQLADAQALGDLQALEARGRRVVRVHLGPDPEVGLRMLAESVV